MTPITEQELLTYLNEIIDCDAFELHIDSAASSLQNFFIPYMRFARQNGSQALRP